MIAWRKVAAFCLRDYRIERSYRLAIALQIATLVFYCLLLFFLGRFIARGRPAAPAGWGADYFTYALVGLAFYSYLTTCLGMLPARLRQEQTSGCLEALCLTPTSLPTLLCGWCAFDFALALLQLGGFFVVGGWLLGARLTAARWLALLLPWCLATVVFFSLGIISASFILVFKRGDPVNWLLSSLFLLLGGVLFPLDVMPAPLQWLARLLPLPYATDAFRAALIAGWSGAANARDGLGLAVFAVVLAPVATLVLARALRRARRSGSLGHY